MTKLLIYLLSLLMLLGSCDKKVEEPANELTSEISSQSIQLDIDEHARSGLQDWLNYYQALDSAFSLDRFILEQVDTMRFMQGTVLGSFEEGFDNIYADFLVYSPNKKQYIDFDSYLWELDDDKRPGFSPDQEINLVDIEHQTVTRIGFNGPSQWVEYALWENDSLVFLCEYSSENMLRIIKLNIQRKERRIFLYPDTLDSESEYFNMRLQRHGIPFD